MTLRELAVVLAACAVIGAGMVLIAAGAEGSPAAPRLMLPAVVIP